MTPHYLIFCFSGQQNKTYYLLKRNKTLGYHILRRNLISCLFYLPICFRFVTLVFPLDMKLYAFVDNSDFFCETNIFWNKYFFETSAWEQDANTGHHRRHNDWKFHWKIEIQIFIKDLWWKTFTGLFLFFNTT